MIDSLSSVLLEHAWWFVGGFACLLFLGWLGKGQVKNTPTHKQVRNPPPVAPPTGTRENTAAETLWVLRDNERQARRKKFWVGMSVVVVLLCLGGLSFFLFPPVAAATVSFFAAWWRQAVSALVTVVALALTFSRPVRDTASVAVEALQWALLVTGLIAAGYAVAITLFP